MVYVSITGLRLKSLLHAPIFWLYAPPAFLAAQRAPGCLRAEIASLDGVHHTLTVWESRKAAMGYVYGPAHKRAIRMFHLMAAPVSRTCGYEAETAPSDWAAARAELAARGRAYPRH